MEGRGGEEHKEIRVGDGGEGKREEERRGSNGRAVHRRGGEGKREGEGERDGGIKRNF